MEPGHVVDYTHGGAIEAQWAPGHPQHSFWIGLKVKKKELISITTYRCTKCGYLESYAMPKGV